MLSAELKNGVVIYQITQENRLVSNIYCERPFCSADSKRFLYARQLDDAGPSDWTQWQYVLCEFGTWESEVVGEGLHQVCISYNNDFYFQRPVAGNRLEFVRLDMATAAVEPVWSCRSDIGRAKHPTVSADGKLLAFHHALSFSPQRFGLSVVNLQTGERNVVYEHPHVCNAHLQFHPTDNRTLLVQLNRGCEYTADGELLKLVGTEGATLLLLDAITGKIEDLQIGKPFTPPITGHQAWIRGCRCHFSAGRGIRRSAWPGYSGPDRARHTMPSARNGHRAEPHWVDSLRRVHIRRLRSRRLHCHRLAGHGKNRYRLQRPGAVRGFSLRSAESSPRLPDAGLQLDGVQL